MSISPFAVGQMLPILQVQLTVDNPNPTGVVPPPPGNPLDLTGLNAGNLSMNIYNTVTKTDQAGEGTFVIVNASQGQIQYFWSALDTATSGNFQLFITVTFEGGPLVMDPIALTVIPK